MTIEEIRSEYEVFLIFYRDVPFYQIPRRFVRQGVHGLRLVHFEEFRRMM